MQSTEYKLPTSYKNGLEARDLKPPENLKILNSHFQPMEYTPVELPFLGKSLIIFLSVNFVLKRQRKVLFAALVSHEGKESGNGRIVSTFSLIFRCSNYNLWSIYILLTKPKIRIIRWKNIPASIFNIHTRKVEQQKNY